MKSVILDGSRITSMAAGGNIPYGASVQYSAAGEVVASVTGTAAALSCAGIAIGDAVRNDTLPGFYEDGNNVPIIVGGQARVWVLGGAVVVFGDYLMLSPTLGAGTENLGVFVEETTGTTRTAGSRARVIGTGVGSADYDQAITTATLGSKTVTFASAAIVTSLGVVVGDYVALDDASAAEINIVTAVGTTTITLQNAMAASYTSTPICYKLTQVEVELV